MEYKPLDFATFEFRLLTILDEKAAGAVIHCSLDKASLIEPPKYRAISYCWGDPLITKSIIVNGCTIQVTTNLEAALQELRAQEFKTLWIDALCINQQDLVERGLQVIRMGLIYSKAYEVLAWLGIEADDSALAINLVNKCNRRSDCRRRRRERDPLYYSTARYQGLTDLRPSMTDRRWETLIIC
jgi:hypothetical protein